MGPVFLLPTLDTQQREETPMERAKRVLVANSPKLMRDVILAALVDQPGVEIVGEVSDEAEIARQVRATSPDLLVIALDPSGRPAICDRILHEHPELRIIAVASHEDRTLYFWASFDIHCADIESSAAGLLEAVHYTAETGRRPS
jgi:DNA-binding NarL/FixJ family response regulator